MTRKTEGVNLLVIDVLATIDQPYSEDITLEVCQAIAGNPQWLNRYALLVDELNQHEVNKAIGRYTKANTGRESIVQVETKDGELIKSYTKLR